MVENYLKGICSRVDIYALLTPKLKLVLIVFKTNMFYILPIHTEHQVTFHQRQSIQFGTSNSPQNLYIWQPLLKQGYFKFVESLVKPLT